MDSVAQGSSKINFWKRRSIRSRTLRFFVYVCLVLLSAIFLIPFAWMVSAAFKDASLLYVNPPVWIPPQITLDNFRRGLQLMLPSFGRLLQNTMIITVLSVVGSVISSSMAGFAFAVLQARGKRLLFQLVLATLMIPISVTLIPQFIFFTRIGWRDTWLPLIVPACFGAPFFIFLFRQFFATIPRDLFDSAELDGCSPWGLYWRIAVPLTKPAFVTAALFGFMGWWNDLQQPMIYLSDMSKFTLTLGLANFQASNYIMIEYLMPMALLALVPTLIVFFLGQRYFVQGIVTTGLKG